MPLSMSSAFTLVRLNVGVVGAASASAEDTIVARDSDELRDDFNWPMSGMGSIERDEISHRIAASFLGVSRFLRKFIDLCELIVYG